MLRAIETRGSAILRPAKLLESRTARGLFALLYSRTQGVGPAKDFMRGEGRQVGGRRAVEDVHADELAQVVHAHWLLDNLDREAVS